MPAFCSVAGCAEEATRWFAAADLWGLGYPLPTFYLCDGCRDWFSPEDDLVRWLDPLSRRIRTTELAVYACADGCRECNPEG
ncbi:hypothetical protein [Hyphomicrobium denitrificans]|nr:hypothetical protein [Hyphomicrobium denitrificans]